jgi:hypothetical protein
MLQEVVAELRSRREPEHLYTAALVAVARGVATIASIKGADKIPFCRHPAIAGAFACLIIAIAVWLKVNRERDVPPLLSSRRV